MKFPKVSIIVLNWNGYKDTVECLDSLKEIDYPNYEIIIIDNGSSDDSVKKIEEYERRFNKEPRRRPGPMAPAGLIQSQKIKFITLTSNLGFAGGNNIGIKNALENGADYILLLNNDTVVEPNFLSELIKVAESDRIIGMLGPKINFYQPKDRIWFLGGKINWLLNKGTHLYYSQFDKNLPQEPFEVDYLSGCALLVKRKVIERIGLMWDGYFLYYEDTDWNLKARRKGWKVVVVPKAKIYHKASQSTKENSFSYIYYHSRNGLYLAKRNGSLLIRFCVYFLSIWIFIKQIIKLLFFPSKRIWAKAIMKGILDFYRGRIGKMRVDN